VMQGLKQTAQYHYRGRSFLRTRLIRTAGLGSCRGRSWFKNPG
jgi:hypothetical protein